MPRTVIADDHALLRAGLARLLKHEVRLVAETWDRSSTARALDTWHPTLLVLDYWMPPDDPIAMVMQFRRDHPNLGIVVMTGTREYAGLHALLGHGVSAIVLKDSGVARLR